MDGLRESPMPRGLRRMTASMVGQRRRTPRCPETPRLDGRLAVVTGATGGIGLEIARGLRRRGAELVLPCRNPEKGARVAEVLRAEGGDAPVRLVDLDLVDLDSVRRAGDAIAADARPLDLLVENAGLWPQRHARTTQGHEVAFGVNVLAHFALRRQLLSAGLLPAARVVVLTGDIYHRESSCTPDFGWRGPLGGMRAYCRSKLGNLWIAAELHRRHPELQVAVVHPGVVATGLGGRGGALGGWLRARLMIPAELGAQMPLVCATQDGLANGGYYHNALGRARLDPSDPALDAPAAVALWETCEALAARQDLR